MPTDDCLIRTAGGLLIELADVPPHHRLRGHGHDHVHLVTVLAGGFRERVRGGEDPCVPGVVRLSPPGARHTLTFGPEGARCLLVHAPAAPCLDDDARTDARDTRFIRDDRCFPALARRVARQVAHRLAAGAAEDDDLALDGHAFELLAQAARRGRGGVCGAPPAWLRRARTHLHDTLRGPPGLAALAREAGVHRAHLARAFREHFGLTPGGYVRVARAERARRLLLHGRAPLAQVAAEAGFADQSHMTRALRAAYGVSPAALRTNGR